MKKPVHATAGSAISILFCLSCKVPLSLSAFMSNREITHMGIVNAASARVAASSRVKFMVSSELLPLTLLYTSSPISPSKHNTATMYTVIAAFFFFIVLLSAPFDYIFYKLRNSSLVVGAIKDKVCLFLYRFFSVCGTCSQIGFDYHLYIIVKVTIKENDKITSLPAFAITSSTTTTTSKYRSSGSIDIQPPTKQVYNIGEELDISGGKAIASGGVYDSSGHIIMNWDQFQATPLDNKMWKIDSSEFDNTKPGKYKIYVIYDTYDMYSGNGRLTSYFTVTVIDENGTFPDTTKATTTTTTVDPYYRFRRVATYPTKTDYKVGESLEIKGLKIISSRNSDKNNEALYSEDFFNADDFEVRDKGGNTVSGDRFSTLPAGNYTVCYTGSISDDGNYTCPDIKLSYLVKIYESSEFPNNTGDQPPFLWGDTNLDGEVDMADAVLIMQYLSNPDKYGLDGTYSRHITQLGMSRCDVDISGKGITSNDALRIQKYLLNRVPNLDPYC